MVFFELLGYLFKIYRESTEQDASISQQNSICNWFLRLIIASAPKDDIPITGMIFGSAKESDILRHQVT